MSNSNQNTVDVVLLASNDNQDHFNLIYDLDNELVSKNDKKVFWGDNKNKICRFCGQGKKSTTFKKKAHILPEFMGNKLFFSNFECDKCNSHFSLYENSLSNYGGILNTFSRVKGKKGYYKHKGINEKTETLVDDNSVKFYINEPTTENPEDFKSFQVDNANKKLTFNTNKYSYTPIHAFKLFVKIGLSFVNECDIKDYCITLNWLIEKGDLNLFDNNPLFTVYQNAGKGVPKHPWVVLMKKRRMFDTLPSPTHVLLISFGLYSFQVFIPGNINDNWIWQKSEIKLPIEQHIVHHDKINNDQIKIWVDNVDLSSKELLKNPKDNFSVGYS
jgi:HNH endonuclease